VRTLAQAHETAGFDRIPVPDGSTIPDATTTVAYAARATSRVHFMLGGLVECDSRGETSSDSGLFVFRNVMRPAYLLDPAVSWPQRR
jgi:hypothetical protein